MLVAVIDLGFQLMLMLVSLPPAAVHWDFALHCPHLPAAHHGPVLPGVHLGKPWGALGVAPAQGALPTVLRMVTASSACQPAIHGQAIICCCEPCGVRLF